MAKQLIYDAIHMFARLTASIFIVIARHAASLLTPLSMIKIACDADIYLYRLHSSTCLRPLQRFIANEALISFFYFFCHEALLVAESMVRGWHFCSEYFIDAMMKGSLIFRHDTAAFRSSLADRVYISQYIRAWLH